MLPLFFCAFAENDKRRPFFINVIYLKVGGVRNQFSRRLVFILTFIFLIILIGCRLTVLEPINHVHLKDRKLFMNYFNYWFKGFGYTVDSVQEGLIFKQRKVAQKAVQGPQIKRTPFLKEKFLIMTSVNFKNGKKGHCFVDLGLFEEEFNIGASPFYINLDCRTPFKTLKREQDLFPEISRVYSITLKSIENFKNQRSFRYYVESKRWPMALKLLKKGVDPKIYMNKYKYIGTTPLNIAFGDFKNFFNRIHSIPFINELLKIEGVLNFKDASGKSSLLKSLLENKRLIAKKLIQDGAFLTVKNKEEQKTFLGILKGYKKEKNGFLELFYKRLANISQFPSSISIKKVDEND